MRCFSMTFPRPFAGHRDSVSEIVGDSLESAIEDVLTNAGVTEAGNQILRWWLSGPLCQGPQSDFFKYSVCGRAKQGGGILVNLTNRPEGQNHLPVGCEYYVSSFSSSFPRIWARIRHDLHAKSALSSESRKGWCRAENICSRVEGGCEAGEKINTKVEACPKQMGWESENWNISYFDQKKYAGYRRASPSSAVSVNFSKKRASFFRKAQ